MRKLTFILLACIGGLSNQAYAASPFGLEIGSFTEANLQEKYSVTKTGVSTWTNGPIYDIPTAQLNFEGLQGATAIFNQDKELVGLLLTFPKVKFEALEGYVSENFNLKSRNIPFVGDKAAVYSKDNTEVWLEAPHLSFQMSMDFLDHELIKLFDTGSQKKQERRVEKEKNALFGE